MLHKRDIGRKLFGIAESFPRCSMEIPHNNGGVSLGLSPYGLDLIFHEAFVEH